MSGDIARAAREPPTGRMARAADPAAEQRGEPDAAEADQQQHPRAAAGRVDVLQRARGLERLAGAKRRTYTRTSAPPAGVVEERPRPGRARRARAAGRQLRWPAGRRLDPPGAGDDLRVAVLLAERGGRKQQGNSPALGAAVEQAAAAAGARRAGAGGTSRGKRAQPVVDRRRAAARAPTPR